jgi:hypothetical protein
VGFRREVEEKDGVDAFRVWGSEEKCNNEMHI